MRYRHLTQDERYQIAWGCDLSVSNADIARQLGRHASTIGRERARNRNASSGTYRAQQAHRTARQRRSQGSSHAQMDAPMQAALLAGLAEKCSPAQIHGRARLLGQPMVGVASLYRYLKRHRLRHLLRLPTRRRPYGRGRAKRFEERKSIHQRPAHVASRAQLGHWELDTVRPSRGTGVLVTHVERSSGYVRLGWSPDGTADAVAEVICARLWRVRDKVLTLTCDRGSEFAQDARIEDRLSTKVYFADPHAPWQRGCNENLNGLLRQYFPRSRDFSTITAQELQQVEHSLNNRPRKRLSYLTPAEVFFNYDTLALRE
ncbi:IS30 family transposase [Xanthomonas cucurbitae]|uniref:IS30 family transposase n=3 Tax=Xanthomonas cucurbitae TaxID=56453 RepID=A0ABY7YCJ9_9XANT|nr:IS30 family transposase [Xanthomonas cucurbitae]QHG86890.1 IS30 family transposase [Xanthomonas cucurbitae]WDM67025.1 IS30 family transposase [Xanthomonas cucurbitae]WDM67255.1 IS30 family transposase [Xanthomonas cucurbitae]WDM67474.1 IS30 family transposase [Xanthomonas cucurbitae]WDM67683.1 IS30 family transposase [Xanthomonas cucurbitae]